MLAAGLLPAGPAEAELFEGSVAEGLGVMVHQPTEADLDGIAALGVGLVRLDLSWGRTERERGVYEFGPYLETARALRARGLRPLFILAFGNKLYSPLVALTHHGAAEKRAAAPADPAAVAAYVAWAAAAAEAFAPFDPVWEIWNEPDQARFWPPEPDPAAYARLAAAACRAIRTAAAPEQVAIIGPAAARFIDSDYLGVVVASEAADCLDAISVHPYKIAGVADEDAAKWAGLRRQITAARPEAPLPIVNSEWGRSNIDRVTEAGQAAYLVRSLVVNQAAGVGVNVWYVWNDRGDAPDDPEDHFGLKRLDGSFRLARVAMATLVDEIGPARFRCIAEEGGVTWALFLRPGELAAGTLVLWSQDGDRAWSPPRDLPVASAVSMTGAALDSGRLALARRVPVYLRLDLAGRSRDSLPASFCPA